jgi:hypothetical protein
MQRHHLRPPILRSKRRIRTQRLHLRARFRENLPDLRRLAVIQTQSLLHHLQPALWIHAPLSALWRSLHLSIRGSPLLLSIRRWRRRILLRDRRTHHQSRTTQHNDCCTKHPALPKVLHSPYLLSLEASRRITSLRSCHRYRRRFPTNVLAFLRYSFAETFSNRRRLNCVSDAQL